MHHTTATRLLFCSFLLSGACSSNQPKFEVSAENDVVSVESADIGVAEEQLPESGAKLLGDEGSVGRFPTGLTVAHVCTALEPESGARRLFIQSPKVERAAYWNNLLRDQPGVREVVVLRTMGLDPRGAGRDDILRESRNSSCELCLIYSRVSETDQDAEYLAALWDVSAKKPVATFRVPVMLPPEERHDSDDENCRRRQRCLDEADYRAEAELRSLVRDAIWELSVHDKPGETKPNPWKSDNPLFPRDDSLKIYTLPASK